ncbi:MAG: hypothetical protein U1F71_10960 [Verrucomicrobiaceae bacterium]
MPPIKVITATMTVEDAMLRQINIVSASLAHMTNLASGFELDSVATLAAGECHGLQRFGVFRRR